MGKQSAKRGICALCGKQKKLTADHIPPKCIFLPLRPSNLITVRTCDDCNRGSKLDDEYFRILLATALDPTASQGRLWREGVARTLERSQKLKEQLVQDMDRAAEHRKARPFQYANGTILPNDVPVLPLDRFRIEAILAKIVRCLHYRKHSQVLSAGHVASIEQAYLPEDLLRLKTSPHKIVVGRHQEFSYCCFDESDETQTWFLLFFEVHLFKVRIHGGDLAREDASREMRGYSSTTLVAP